MKVTFVQQILAGVKFSKKTKCFSRLIFSNSRHLISVSLSLWLVCLIHYHLRLHLLNYVWRKSQWCSFIMAEDRRQTNNCWKLPKFIFRRNNPEQTSQHYDEQSTVNNEIVIKPLFQLCVIIIEQKLNFNSPTDGHTSAWHTLKIKHSNYPLSKTIVSCFEPKKSHFDTNNESGINYIII